MEEIMTVTIELEEKARKISSFLNINDRIDSITQ